MHQAQLKASFWIVALSLMLVVGCAGHSKTGKVGNPHVAQAIAHGQETVEHGGMGHADEVVTHAEVSL